MPLSPTTTTPDVSLPLADYTAQQVYDAVAKALLKQGKPSVDEQNHCQYRGPNGLKCAAGHLIPDRLYNPTIENKQISVLLLSKADRKDWFSPELSAWFGEEKHADLIYALQQAHDNATSEFDEEGCAREWFPTWKFKMFRLASQFHLNTNAFKGQPT